MTAVVIGGAGFIGSHIVDELMHLGHKVCVLDNLSEGKLENIERWRSLEGTRFEFIEGDIRDFNIVKRAVTHSDWVFHLAAMSRIQPSITDPMLAWSQNVIGTGNVLEACRQEGVSRVVYSASSSAYGRINVPPLVETMPADCLNPYSLSKYTGEKMCEVYNQLYKLPTVSLRYFNVYGPRHQEEGSYATVIAIFRKQLREGKPLTIVGDGSKRRDFTFVGDVVRANMLAAANRDASGTFNIGSGVNYSINQVAAMILGQDMEHYDFSDGSATYIPDRLGEAQVTLADCSKAKRVLGWSPNIGLKYGLELIDNYEKKMARSRSPIIL